MSFDCTEHEMSDEVSPCPLCMKALEIQEIEASQPPVPDQVVKHVHVHDPGPCPECARRAAVTFRQRKALLLSVAFAAAGLVAGALLELKDPAKWFVLVPSIVVAVLGVLIPPARAHAKLDD
jgi:hypothetical protein